MKIRTDFVSNSSSSSFIVIGGENYANINYYGDTITLPTYKGRSCFGWEFEKHYDFFSKLNFCALLVIYAHSYKEDIAYWEKQALTESDFMSQYTKNRIATLQKWYDRHDEMKDMLINVCKDDFNLNIEFDYSAIDSCGAYIDHQSNMCDSPENASMFDDSGKLYDFLASEDSYIATGNDNEEAPEGWYN